MSILLLIAVVAIAAAYAGRLLPAIPRSNDDFQL